MDYLLSSNNAILKFPYSLEELRSDNPQTSFPWEISAEELAEWGVFAVEEQAPPAYNEQTEAIELKPPSFINGVWVMSWSVRTATAEEIELKTAVKADLIRKRRNQLLANSDPSQLLDFPGSAEVKSSFARIRQQLRDIPQQSGFPWDVIWPGLPTKGA
jgi:hypothetical protein